jgi:predicted nucleotidyltransferase
MAPTVVQTKDEILDRLRQCEPKLQELGVTRLGLFGSFVREEQDSTSDIDVLVEFAPGKKSFDAFMGIAFLLEDELQRRVELVTFDSLSPYIGPRILAEVEDVLVGS